MELNLRLEKLTRGGQDRVHAGSGVVSIFHMSFFLFFLFQSDMQKDLEIGVTSRLPGWFNHTQ